MKPIKMAADPICDGQHAGGPARSEWLLAKDDGSLKNVFVYVEEGLNGKKFNREWFWVTGGGWNLKGNGFW